MVLSNGDRKILISQMKFMEAMAIVTTTVSTERLLM